MRRRHSAINGSLDLLLDTICNTFGGVLFVAMLVVVMLRMTAKTADAIPREAVTEVELLELERQQAEVRTVLDSQRRATEQLSSQQSLVDPAAAELWQQLTALQNERDVLIDTRLATLGRTAKLQASINQVTKALAEIESDEQDLKSRRAEVTLALDEERKSRTHDADLPRLRTSDKIEVQTALRYGRFYIWHKYDNYGIRSGLNTDDYIVLEDTPSSIVTTQLPYAGTPIDKSDESHQAVKARLGRFGSNRHYIQVTVWLDSFEQFRHIKEVLVTNGFDYRLTPAMAESQFIDRGGKSEGIQ